MKRKRIWLEQEIQYLKDNYIDKTCEQISIKLNRSIRSVQHKYFELQLKRPQKIVRIKRCKHLIALGEKKTISEWSKDPRCKVGYFTLKQRIILGWSDEDAILKDIIKRKTIPMNIGEERNYLTLLEKFIKEEKNNTSYTYGKFKCRCGNIVEYRMSSIESEGTKSCGCYIKEIQRKRFKKLNYIHGYTEDGRIFQEYCGIIGRCHKINHHAYFSYGARGIKVCDEWKNNYLKFKEWALSNGYQDNLSIDRIDTNYDYCPENCRWTDNKGQYETKRNNKIIVAFGEVKSLLHWTRDKRCKVDINIIKERLASGWSTEDAIGKELEECII